MKMLVMLVIDTYIVSSTDQHFQSPNHKIEVNNDNNAMGTAIQEL